MERQEIEFTTRLTREDVAGLIEALIEGLKDGKLKVKKSNEVLELDVPRVVDLEIEASIDDERAEFEIEVSWRTNRAENPDLPAGNGEKASPKPSAKTSPAAKSTAAKATKKTAKPATGKSASKTAAGSKKSTPAAEKKAASSSAAKSKGRAAPKSDKE